MWKTEHTHESAAAPEAVFALWADVEGWPAWDASLIATTLDGPFAAGTTGTLHPQGMPGPIAFEITAVEPGAGFADETRLGPLVLRFRHRVERAPGRVADRRFDRGGGARRRAGRPRSRRGPARERGRPRRGRDAGGAARVRSAHASAWDSPGFLLWHATLRWQRAMRAALAPHDLTHVQFVLLASAWWLGEQGEQPAQRRLAEHAGTDAMMTSQVVRALERAGPRRAPARSRRRAQRARDRDAGRPRPPAGRAGRRRGRRHGVLRAGRRRRARAPAADARGPRRYCGGVMPGVAGSAFLAA